MSDDATLRAGVVSYVNAWPLTEGLDAVPGIAVTEHAPCGVAAALRGGLVDFGLVPVIETARQPDLEVVPAGAVGAFGRVGSVIMLLRKAPHAVRTLAVDAESRTSQVLGALILERVFGARFEVAERDPVRAWESAETDAVVMIGDRALEWSARGLPCLDLADAWTRFTGLPFVFAVWAARPGVLGRWPRLPEVLAEARRRGQARIPQLAERAAARSALDASVWQVYLTRRIRYGLGQAEMLGARRFLELATGRHQVTAL